MNENSIRHAMERMTLPELRETVNQADLETWRPEALEVAERVLGEREANGEEVPGCPDCFTEMEPGSVTIHETLRAFFLLGISHQHAWFVPANGEKKRPILSSREHRSAHHCPNCGCVVMSARK